MSKEESISEEISNLKSETKRLVKKLQNLKQKLSSGEISLSEFKGKKASLEDALRSILKKITEYKEQRTVRVKKEKVQEEQEELQEQKTRKVQIPTEIDKEIQIAEEAKELMHHFQTQFEDSITRAKIYLSITLDEHFEIQIDFSNYPQRPELILPDDILQLYENKEDFLENIPNYKKWDKKNPLEIYKLIQEIEYVLINKFNADLDTIEEKVKAQQQELRNKLRELEQEAKTLIENNEIKEAINLYYAMVDLAYDLQEHEKVTEITNKIEELKQSRGGF